MRSRFGCSLVEKWERFCTIRLPQWMGQIREKRDRYVSVMERIESSKRASPSNVQEKRPLSPDLER
ncbi:MAG: hypothetical protein WCD18_26780 [Thermosynechococcaceae cyanobacterium]